MVDLITQKDELATVVTYAANLGYKVEVQRGPESENGGWPEAVLRREDLGWADEDIAHQVVLAAVAYEETPRRVMDRVAAILARKNVDMEALVPKFTRATSDTGDAFEGADGEPSDVASS